MEKQKDFASYVRELGPEQKKEFAERCGTSYRYLIQLINGHRRASSKLAKKFREQSGHIIRLASVRPDIWAD